MKNKSKFLIKKPNAGEPFCTYSTKTEVAVDA